MEADVSSDESGQVAPARPPGFGASPRVYQAILTRFDLRWSREAPSLDADWRAARLRLMERLLGASVRAQTMAMFTWWIYCDLVCPAETLTRIRRIDPRVRIALVGPKDEPAAAIELADARIEAANGLGPSFPTDVDVIVSTRFDSDDAMDPRFMEVQRERVPLFLSLDLPRFLVVAGAGYQYDDVNRVAIHRVVPRIAMQTMYERADMVSSFVTGNAGNHGRVLEQYPGFADIARNSWLNVIHAHNRSSVMGRGAPVDLEVLRREFVVEW